MRVSTAAACVAAMLVAGCATSPENIQAQYVSHVPYMEWECSQLAAESIRTQQALATASVKQNETRSNDTAGVIFLGLPVSAMSGGNVAPEIARYKGEIEAINKAMTLKNCGTAPAAPAAQPKT